MKKVFKISMLMFFVLAFLQNSFGQTSKKNCALETTNGVINGAGAGAGAGAGLGAGVGFVVGGPAGAGAGAAAGGFTGAVVGGAVGGTVSNQSCKNGVSSNSGDSHGAGVQQATWKRTRQIQKQGN